MIHLPWFFLVRVSGLWRVCPRLMCLLYQIGLPFRVFAVSSQICLHSERNRQDAKNAKIRSEKRGEFVLSVHPCRLCV